MYICSEKVMINNLHNIYSQSTPSPKISVCIPPWDQSVKKKQKQKTKSYYIASRQTDRYAFRV